MESGDAKAMSLYLGVRDNIDYAHPDDACASENGHKGSMSNVDGISKMSINDPEDNV